MPLAFRSESHGTIAFGFFNIETDLLLLEQLFFFADRFCEAVVALAGADDGEARLDGWRIADRAHLGNLHVAIAGVDLSGLIGASYRLFPFPSRPEDFKQSPDGERNQGVMEPLLDQHGSREELLLRWDRRARIVMMSELAFREEVFATLIEYVDRGGYPRWRDEARPHCVRSMMERLDALSSPLFPRRVR